MLAAACAAAMLALHPSGKPVAPESRPALRPVAAALTGVVGAPPAFAEIVDNPYARSAVVQQDSGSDFIGNIVGFVFNSALNLAFVGLLLFSLKFLYDSVQATDFTPVTRLADEEDDDERKAPTNLSQVGDALFDDSGTGAVTGPAEQKKGKRNNMAGVVRRTRCCAASLAFTCPSASPHRRTHRSFSLQAHTHAMPTIMSQGGREFAPWMKIDQNRIEQAKKAREQERS